jgi:hypothetical protein
MTAQPRPARLNLLTGAGEPGDHVPPSAYATKTEHPMRHVQVDAHTWTRRIGWHSWQLLERFNS